MRTLAYLSVSVVLGSCLLACSGPADVASKNNVQTVGGNSGQGGSTNVTTGGTTTNATGGTTGTSTAQVNDIRSDVSPITNPDITDAEYATFITNANDFGLTLYKGVNSGAAAQQNAVFSPTSAQLALAMTYAGAVGDTAAGMQTTLKDTLGSAKYHAGCNRMMRDLVNRNLTQTDAHDVTRRVEFAPANSLWVDLGTSVKTPFLNLLAAHYNSGVYGVNFSTQPDASRIAINDWVSGHTHDRIKDLLSQNDVDSSTRIVLVNALYFFANWSDLFFKTATSPATFHTLAGTDVSADTMHKSAHMLYKATDTYQVLNISYVSGDLSMVVVLPNADAFDATRAQISAQWVEDNRNGLTSTNVDLSLPKFSIGTGQMHLKDTLSSMGMQLAFTGSADFSGISTDTRLQISDVIQKAFIGVDESGTEASAATAVMLNGSGPPQTPVDFNVNRPFIYYIQDKTGLVLFAGQVVDPTS